MGIAALNPSYGTTWVYGTTWHTVPHGIAPVAVGWVERSETHHVVIRAYTQSSMSAAPRQW